MTQPKIWQGLELRTARRVWQISKPADADDKGKAWAAQANAQILTSVLLRNSRGTNNAALTLAVGVALHRALQSLLPEEQSLRIKWPNDIEAKGRKLAGILTESTTSESAVVTVVGIGLNVWEPPSPVAGEVQPIALRTLGLDVSRESLMVRLLQALAEAVATFERDDLVPFVPYLNQYDALLGTTISVDGVEGQAAGIASDGALRVATAQGVVAVSSGTIERKSPAVF